MEPQIHPEGGWNHAESVAVMTAQALNEAGIPCILWGSCSVALWGVERMKTTLDFVVADDLADKAIQTLLDTQPFPWTVTRCQHPARCEARDNEAENFPSKRHLHWLPLVHDACTRFQIFSRSEILFMPPMDKLPSGYEDSAAFAEALGPHFLLASDSSRLPPLESFWHTGVFKSGRHPIVAPMPHVVVEAEMRLYARYCQKDWKYLWGQTRAALGADRRVVDPELMSDPVLRDLFVRERDQKFSECGEFSRLLNEALGEKPYVMKWPTLPPQEQGEEKVDEVVPTEDRLGAHG